MVALGGEGIDRRYFAGGELLRRGEAQRAAPMVVLAALVDGEWRIDTGSRGGERGHEGARAVGNRPAGLRRGRIDR